MNRRVLVVLTLAFFIAAGCSYLVLRIVGNRAAANHPASTSVVVATSDVKLGSVLKAENLGTVQLSGPPPKGAILRRQDAIGRGVISDIYQGEPIVESRLAPVGAGGGLASTIPPGMRACAIKVDDVVGVAGFVTPGSHVDVLITGNPPGAPNPTDGSKVKTLLQNIEVLSAGTDIQRDNGAAPNKVQVVNLLVTPEQAEDLSLASAQTHIQLVLRNPLDTQIAQPPGTAVGTLFSGVAEVTPLPKPHVASGPPVHTATKAVPPPGYKVQVYNGSKQSETKFDSGEETK